MIIATHDTRDPPGSASPVPPGASGRRPGVASRVAVLVCIVAAVVSPLLRAVDARAELAQRVLQHHRGVPGDPALRQSVDPVQVSGALAERYLHGLTPEVRRRIGTQVRAEQREGLTPPGTNAFVLRRLELYEEEIRHRAGLR